MMLAGFRMGRILTFFESFLFHIFPTRIYGKLHYTSSLLPQSECRKKSAGQDIQTPDKVGYFQNPHDEGSLFYFIYSHKCSWVWLWVCWLVCTGPLYQPKKRYRPEIRYTLPQTVFKNVFLLFRKSHPKSSQSSKNCHVMWILHQYFCQSLVFFRFYKFNCRTTHFRRKYLSTQSQNCIFSIFQTISAILFVQLLRKNLLELLLHNSGCILIIKLEKNWIESDFYF